MQLATEAASILAAYDLELMTWPEVITWADAWVMRLDPIPDELLEVSLSTTNPKNGYSAVRRLTEGLNVNGRTVFLNLISRRRDAFEAGSIDSVGVARQAYRQMYQWLDLDNDLELMHPVYLMDHLDDAVHGIHQLTPEQQAHSLQQLQEAVRDFLNAPA